MIILALDYGEKRIGVASSDPNEQFSFSVGVIDRTSLEKDIDRIYELLLEKQAGKIVVGLPLNMDGSSGQKVQEVREFCEILSEKIGCEIVFWDERLTTMQAERTLISADVSRKKRRSVIDKMAAQLILQSYLDCNRS